MNENEHLLTTKSLSFRKVWTREKQISTNATKQILYLESYSHWENPKFEGILELFQTSAQQCAAAEDTRTDLLIPSKFFLRKKHFHQELYTSKNLGNKQVTETFMNSLNMPSLTD